MADALSACLVLGFLLLPVLNATPLDDYVLKGDPNYSWYDTGSRITGCFLTGRWKGVVLNMTSQSWLSSSEVDCSIWTHHLVIVTPKTILYERTAFLLIAGSSNTDGPPTARDELLLLAAGLAVKTKTLAAVLYQAPNQPCRFSSDGWRLRSEDDFVAYTWAHYLQNPEKVELPAQLPMTKAAIRAMDTIQDYASQQLNLKVESFVVAGASKRGWTTWLAAAVDNRVAAIVPMVMDALQFVRNMHHFYQSLGGWPWAFEPYHSCNLTANLDTPEFHHLMTFVDPYVYVERLTLPKLIVTSSNDEFFLLDDSSFFWNELKGEKHFLILSNTDHNLFTGLPKLLAAVEAFHLSIVLGNERGNLGPKVPVDSSSKVTDGTPFWESSGQTRQFQSAKSSTQQRVYSMGLSERPNLRMRLSDLLSLAKPLDQLLAPHIRWLQEVVNTPSPVQPVLGWSDRPEYWWKIDRDKGSLEVAANSRPSKVTLWYTYTNQGNTRRDFRWIAADFGNCSTFLVAGKCFQSIFFHHRKLRPVAFKATKDGSLKYVATISLPQEGYGAFFIELRFKGPQTRSPFIFTTEAVIVPNTFPFPDCSGVVCRGILV